MCASDCTVGVDDSIGLGEKVLIAVVMYISNAIRNKINLDNNITLKGRKLEKMWQNTGTIGTNNTDIRIHL